MAITHHGFEPRGLPIQVFYRRDFAAENTVVAVLLQLASKHQTGAIEGEDIEVIHQDGHAHALAEHLHRLDVGEWTGTHAKSDNIQWAGHGVAYHHISKCICHSLFEGKTLPGPSPASEELEHSFGSVSCKKIPVFKVYKDLKGDKNSTGSNLSVQYN